MYCFLQPSKKIFATVVAISQKRFRHASETGAENTWNEQDAGSHHFAL